MPSDRAKILIHSGMARPTTHNRAFVAAYIGSSARCHVDATRNPPQVKELKAEVLIRNSNKKANSWSKAQLVAWLESNPREEATTDALSFSSLSSWW